MSRDRTVRRAGAAVVAVALGLSGCATQPVDLSVDAAARLQEAVFAVTAAAAQGRHDAAATAVERVRSELDDAVEDGEISVQRYRAVDGALRAVEAELAALRGTAEEEATDDADGGTTEPEEPEEDEAAAQQEPVTPAVPLPAPAEPADEPSDRGRGADQGNQGNGVGPDNNRGRGGGQGQGKGQGRSPGGPSERGSSGRD
ncbi:MAG: hypothetical protein H5T83_10650 [Actinotalea sp.]|nr:hypothetical protein [Actinotalea sp.]